jgi:hydrogenase nickel incorporation protein HypA/HybF
MHELAVCQALIDQVETIARSRGARRVITIKLEIGPLSGVEAQLLRHAYPLAAHGTLAEDAQLLIDVGGVRVRCSHCRLETDTPSNRLVCGTCGDWRVRVVSGDELVLASVELERAGPQRAVA